MWEIGVRIPVGTKTSEREGGYTQRNLHSRLTKKQLLAQCSNIRKQKLQTPESKTTGQWGDVVIIIPTEYSNHGDDWDVTSMKEMVRRSALNYQISSDNRVTPEDSYKHQLLVDSRWRL